MPLPHAQFETIHHIGMRILRSPQNQLFTFQNVDQAGIALDQRGGKIHHASQNFVKSVGCRQPVADLVQQINM